MEQEIDGYNVGVLAKLSEETGEYIIEAKTSSSTICCLYLDEEDAVAAKNRFIRQYFPDDTTEIPLQLIENPIAEDIYGDWQSREFISVVSLDYGEKGKQGSLEQGEYRVGYLINSNKITMFSHSPSITILDGKNGVLKTIKGDSYINRIYPKKLLQEKIFDTKKAQNEQFAAVIRGIENEDVTTYVCSHFGSRRLEELEENGVYLRFPHSVEGYWEDYFLKLNDENFRKLEDETILSKQEKFVYDLGLFEKQDGFAIVPFKYNGHFVTLVVDCSQKTINLFDSSLYTAVGDEGKSEVLGISC